MDQLKSYDPAVTLIIQKFSVVMPNLRNVSRSHSKLPGAIEKKRTHRIASKTSSPNRPPSDHNIDLFPLQHVKDPTNSGPIPR